jgi:hypothetical protein
MFAPAAVPAAQPMVAQAPMMAVAAEPRLVGRRIVTRRKPHTAARIVVGIVKAAALVALIAGPLAIPAYLIGIRDSNKSLGAGVVLALVFADILATILFVTLIALPAFLLETMIDLYDEQQARTVAEI